MFSQINIRFLIKIAVAVTIFSIGWFLLHRSQTNRRLDWYLSQIQQAEQEQKFERASRLLRAYILLSPEDLEARIRYGGLLEKLSTSKKTEVDALEVYERILKDDPDRHEVRRKSADLAARVGHWDRATDHLVKLRAIFPADSKILFLTGVCLEAKSRWAEAAEVYELARRIEPTPETHVRLASLLRARLKQPGDADRVMDDLVKARPNHAESYLARSAYARAVDRDGRGDAAIADIDNARRLAPDRVDVLSLSAELLLDKAARDPMTRNELLNRAREYLTRGIEKDSQNPLLYKKLAQTEIQAARPEEALKVLQEARRKVPLQNQSEILFTTAELLTDKGDTSGAEDALVKLRTLGHQPAHIDLVTARGLVAHGRWSAASQMIERIRPLFIADLNRSLQADLLLATCYGQMGEIDRQLSVYARATNSAPFDTRPRIGLATAYLALGRLDEAVDEYDRIVRDPTAPTGAWLVLARLQVFRNLSRREVERNWKDVNSLLDRVEKLLPAAIEITLLRAEILVSQRDFASARVILTSARDRKPEEADFWFALSSLADREGDTKKAMGLLDEAQKRLGDSVDLRLARLRLIRRDAENCLKDLARDTDKFNLNDRVQLFRALGSAYWAGVDPNQAMHFWQIVADLRPSELQVRVLLFDAALLANDESRMQRILEEIRAIEGDGPIEKYCRAILLIHRADRGDRSGLIEARALLSSAGARRPGWLRIPLAIALIDQLEGNTSHALESYKQAVQFGSRDPAVIRRLVQMYYDRQQYAEADELLRRIQAQAPISNDLARLAAEVSLRNFDIDRAIQLGRAAVSADSSDFRDRIWYGQILSAAGRSTEALAEFEKAAALAPDHPDPIVALVQHHVWRSETTLAEAAIQKAQNRFAGNRGALALAECYDRIGQRDRADSKYQELVKANSSDFQVLRAATQFYLRISNNQKAEAILRTILSLAALTSADAAWARRNLALTIGQRGTEAAFNEAIALLDRNSVLGEDGTDLTIRAVVLATRPSRRKESIGLFENVEKTKALLPDHEFVLAKLYEAEGNWPKARDRMLGLIGHQKNNSAYVAAFTQSLLRREEWIDASVWAGRLREIEPNSLLSTTLQIRVWIGLGKIDQCVPLINNFAEKSDGDTVIRTLAAADLMEEVSRAGDPTAQKSAENYYLRYRSLVKTPTACLPLAAHYGRHDNPEKALALCSEAISSGCPIERVAEVAAGVVAGENVTPAHLNFVESLLTKAHTAHPELDDVLLNLAILRERQKRFEEAESLYREFLSRNPGNIGGLNNLAMLLALKGKSDEAIALIARASEMLIGSSAGLDDTLGVALTSAGRLTDAQKILDRAAANGGSATCQYHRALLFDKLSDRQRAVSALQISRKKGFKPSNLHPLERSECESLIARLGNP